MKFYLPLSTRHRRLEDLREMNLVRILTHCSLLPIFFGSYLQAQKKTRCPSGFYFVTRNYRGEKNNFPSIFYSHYLVEIPFFLRHLKKWIQVKSCFFFTVVTVMQDQLLFSPSTKFYSLEASPWTQSSLSQTWSDLQPNWVSFLLLFFLLFFQTSWVSKLDAVQLWLVSGPHLEKKEMLKQSGLCSNRPSNCPNLTPNTKRVLPLTTTWQESRVPTLGCSCSWSSPGELPLVPSSDARTIKR